MRKRSVAKAMVLGLALAVTTPAVAFSAERPVNTTADGVVTYVTGGIGEEERVWMQGQSGEYSLRLTLATDKGHFLSDVNVEVINAAGETVLEVVSDGPFVYANLPAGNYSIKASGFGQSLIRTVKVNGPRPVDVVLHWRATPEILGA